MQTKIEKIFFDLEILASELVALNTSFYWETMHFIAVNVLTKSPKISDSPITELFELIFSLNDQKILEKYCR